MTRHRELTGEELSRRSDEVLLAAERVARELQQQNDRLAQAIEQFHREVLTPLREGEDVATVRDRGEVR